MSGGLSAPSEAPLPRRWVAAGVSAVAVTAAGALAFIAYHSDWPWDSYLAVGLLALGTVAALVGVRGGWVRFAIDRARRPWPATSGVGHIRRGSEDVGCVTRVGRRYLVCVPAVVNRALSRPDDDLRRPDRNVHVEVAFPAGRGTSGGQPVWARIVEWGPSRPFRTQIVVLRATRRLPHGIRRLTLSAAHRREGRSILVVPDAEGAAFSNGAGAGVPPARPGGQLILDLRVDRAFLQKPVPGMQSRQLGAPLVAFPQEGLGTELPGEVLAVVAGGAVAGEGPAVLDRVDVRTGDVTDTKVDARAGGQGSGEVLTVVPAPEVRAVLGDVRRRTVLRSAMAGAGIAATAGGAWRWRITKPPPLPTPVLRLRGAGWSGLFTDGQVAAFLEHNHVVVTVDEYSGVDLLEMTAEDLRTFDFVTCPNSAVEESMGSKAHRIIGKQPPSPVQLCQDPMVVLTRQEYLPALVNAGLLAQTPTGVDLDLAAYLQRYGIRWVDVDPGFPGPLPGQVIRIGHSNPLRAGGGEVFLTVLDEVGTRLGWPTAENGRRLWEDPRSGKAPLSDGGEKTTKNLLNSFGMGSQEMVYVYEHDAISWLLKQQDPDSGKYAILHTCPEARPEQYLLTFTDRARPLRDLFSDPRLQEVVFRQLNAQTPESARTGEYQKLLASERLSPAYQYRLPHPPGTTLVPWRATLADMRMQVLVDELREWTKARSPE